MPIVWPPDYTIRQSKRARQVLLRITRQGGLQIIVPCSFNLRHPEELLLRHRHWIEKNWERTQPLSVTERELPNTIQLHAIGQTWQVIYQKTATTQVYLRTTAPACLTLQGNITERRKCQLLLRNWLRKLAGALLLPWLTQLSQETGLSFERAKIGNAATRWGSCSTKRHITLNWQLLFLPKNLARHVLLHELCHTKIMNHSAAFWNLLTQFDQHTASLRKTLKHSNHYLPDWLGAA